MQLAILFGGSSFEHEISIVSAITMKKVLKKSALTFIFLDKDREFYLVDTQAMKSSHFSSGDYKKDKKLTLKHGGFFAEGMFGSKDVPFDAVLNLIHGRDGEDGKIASLMAFYGVPCIGPGTEASVMSYNKLYTKLFAQSVGVETTPWQHLDRNSERKVTLDYPVIVKPVRLGSSIGVSVVRSEAELDYALDVAFEFDSDVIVEPFIEQVREYNQAGCKTDAWELSIVEEPQKEEFLDFDKKYMDFARDSRVMEADIDEALRETIRESFKKVYDPLFAGSLIRCDFFVVEGKVLLNEINPIPGSMANYLFEDFEGIVTRLVNYLPKERTIAIDYRYIHSIQKAKGKSS
jgi:D-alanine-D-alanine ligase